MPRTRIALLFCLAGTACFRFTGPLSALRPVAPTDAPRWTVCGDREPCADAAVSLTYLGVGGFIIRSGREGVMTAPSFNHPSWWSVAMPMVRIRSDTTVVDRAFRALLGDSVESSLRGVESILVGHAHYDHLMDVPYIARRYLPSATIHGSMTTKRILMGDAWLREHARQIDSIPESVTGTPWRVGTWIYSASRRWRFMPLRSSHAPNWWFITMAPCHTADDRASLPRTAWGWCMGEPLSYLIDVLDAAGRPALRIYYQDAAAHPIDVLLPPFTGADRKDVDVAIVCAGNFKKVADYPTLLLAALHPRYVIVAHWEDFFHPVSDPLTPVRFTDTEELAARLDLTVPGRWITPVPGAAVTVRY